MGASEEVLKTARRLLGNRIRELRKAERLSQEEASRQAGITARNWSRIERGELNLRLDSLLGIQAALRVETVDALFGPTTTELLRGHREAPRK
jgi:transcriptional regulator with XRE-family HTH domain